MHIIIIHTINTLIFIGYLTLSENSKLTIKYMLFRYTFNRTYIINTRYLHLSLLWLNYNILFRKSIMTKIINQNMRIIICNNIYIFYLTNMHNYVLFIWPFDILLKNYGIRTTNNSRTPLCTLHLDGHLMEYL